MRKEEEALEPRVQLYTTRICGYCRAAKRLLTARGVSFEEIDLSTDPDARQELVNRTGWQTVPVIVMDGELIGGYTELARLDQQGELAP